MNTPRVQDHPAVRHSAYGKGVNLRAAALDRVVSLSRSAGPEHEPPFPWDLVNVEAALRAVEGESSSYFNRPHGGLGGQTPYERLRAKTRARRERTLSAAHLGRYMAATAEEDSKDTPLTRR